MTTYVELEQKRNRGWPWPEESFGLTPMFGAGGWCHECGVPLTAQTGSIILQRKGIKVEGAWIPNWQFDAICMSATLGEIVQAEFDVPVLPVRWHGTALGDAVQIVVPSVGESWFDHDELRANAIARHGTAGATCQKRGVWRWMPLGFGSGLPALRIAPALAGPDVAASPEWFGDGQNAYRQILMRRELAEVLVAASPKDFRIMEVA